MGTVTLFLALDDLAARFGADARQPRTREPTVRPPKLHGDVHPLPVLDRDPAWTP